MKIVYVGDNRQRGNYGCRATSTALSQLISEEHQIVGRVTGRYNMWNMGNLFFISGIPTYVYRILSKLPGWRKIKKIWSKILTKLLGKKIYFSCFDFVRNDVKKTRKNLLRCISANPEIKEFDLSKYDFDALVINGEGSFIFATPPWRESLIIAMLMDWAEEMGKKVYFMNAMLSDDPHSKHNEETVAMFRPILEKCSAVCLREHYSMEYCSKYFPNVKSKLYPDALFTWYEMINDEHRVSDGKYYMPHELESDEFYKIFDFTKPYVCLAGSSASKLGENKEEGIRRYSELARKIREELPASLYLIKVCEGDEFLEEVGRIVGVPVIPVEMPIVAAGKILANAEVFITGRYHPAILASLGGTPCVIMSSNSHKTLSLQDILEYKDPVEYAVLPNHSEQEEIIAAAKRIYEIRENERRRLKNKCLELSNWSSKMREEWNV